MSLDHAFESKPYVTRRLALQGQTARDLLVTSIENQEALIAVTEMKTDTDLELFPYGRLLWASAIGLAERLAETPEQVYGKRVLELGAGVGLPGLVARLIGAEVVQTDYQQDVLDLARFNARQNSVTDIAWHLADWRRFPDLGLFDLVIGSDILYERSLHGSLHTLLPRVMQPDGLLLISDPLRPQAIDFMDRKEREGWEITIASRLVDWEGCRQEIGLFETRIA